MNIQIEKLIERAGNDSRYQYMMLLLIFFLYGTSEFITIAIPYVEVKPIISILVKGVPQEVNINYSLCEEFKLNNKTPSIVESLTRHSIVYDFNIYCNQLATTLIGTIIFSGILIGSLISHHFSDNFGRKKTVVLFGILYILSCFLYSLINNLEVLYINLFFSGFCYIIVALSSVVLLNEVLRPERRAIFSSILYSAYSLFGIVYPLFFHYLNTWKVIFLIIGISHLIFYSVFFLYVEESPRFLISKGKYIEFRAVMEKIGRKNGKAEHDLVGLNTIKTREEEEKQSIINQKEDYISLESMPAKILDNTPKKEYSVFDLIRYPSQRMNFIAISLVWFACSIIFYGLIINIKNLEGNIYFQGIYINSFEIFFIILSGLLANTETFGRKKSIILYLTIAGICLFSLIFLPREHIAFDILLMITRYCVSSVFCIIYYVSNEVYPTVLRSKGLAINSVISRLGGISAPSIIEILEFNYVLIVYFVLNIISLFFVFFLEETYNIPLKDQIPEEIINKD